MVKKNVKPNPLNTLIKIISKKILLKDILFKSFKQIEVPTKIIKLWNNKKINCNIVFVPKFKPYGLKPVKIKIKKNVSKNKLILIPGWIPYRISKNKTDKPFLAISGNLT